MSVRAYREIKPPVLANDCSFNLWHETDVLEALLDLSETSHGGSDYQIDYLEVNADELEELLLTKEFRSKCNDDSFNAFKNDIAAVREVGDNYIVYHCY